MDYVHLNYLKDAAGDLMTNPEADMHVRKLADIVRDLIMEIQAAQEDEGK